MREIGRPVLQVVPLDDCMLHESVDPERVERIARRLEADDTLRNPPVAGRSDDARFADGKLLVLDGATRLSGLSRLGYQTTVVQIVDYDDPRIELKTWAHHLPATSADDVLAALRAIPGIRTEPVAREAAPVALRQADLLCYVGLPGGETWAIAGGASLEESARLLDAVFASYAGRLPIRREAVDEGRDPVAHAATSAAVVFRRYAKADLLAIATAGLVLPGGVTRHIIPGRALRLNLPLSMLREGSLAEQGAALGRWLRAREEGGHIRLYNEPTWLFDE